MSLLDCIQSNNNCSDWPPPPPPTPSPPTWKFISLWNNIWTLYGTNICSLKYYRDVIPCKNHITYSVPAGVILGEKSCTLTIGFGNPNILIYIIWRIFGYLFYLYQLYESIHSKYSNYLMCDVDLLKLYCIKLLASRFLCWHLASFSRAYF